MAIEILKRGVPLVENSYTVDCGNCKSKLRFKYSDGKLTDNHMDAPYLSINCPVCDSVIEVSVRNHDRCF